MKANKTINELKVSDSNTYRLKTEERTKNNEEWRKIFTDLLTETYFFTQNSQIHSLGVMKILEEDF